MARKRRRGRHRHGGGGGGSGGGGGALTKLRGGFKSTVHSATGTSKGPPASRARRVLGNVVTVALLLIAAAVLLRRFGVFK
jgi:hypothetical protein